MRNYDDFPEMRGSEVHLMAMGRYPSSMLVNVAKLMLKKKGGGEGMSMFVGIAQVGINLNSY